MLSAPLIAVGAGVLALPLLTVMIFLGAGSPEVPTGSVCTIVTEATATGSPPAPAGAVQLDAQQAANARTIVAISKAAGLPEQAAAIAVMTSQQESSLRVLANPIVPGSQNYPHQGTGSDHDSVGLFQQRPSQGWGTLAQLMDPATSTSLFLQALADVPGWQSRTPWEAAQAVQRSANGNAYSQWAPLGIAVARALWGTSSSTLSCRTTQISGTFTGAGAAQACSVIPDPSTGTGCLTPRMATLYTHLLGQGWRPGCFRPSDPVAGSDHPLGRACDVPPGSYGALPTAEQKARGDALAAQLQASAAQTGLDYLIWSGRIWSTARANEGWRPYNGAGVYSTTPTTTAGITGGHYDHIHISVY